MMRRACVSRLSLVYHLQPHKPLLSHTVEDPLWAKQESEQVYNQMPGTQKENRQEIIQIILRRLVYILPLAVM